MPLFQILLVCVFVILSCSAWPWNHREKTTLLLVQTIFRHGDRAPLKLYPTDPNGVDAWPNGLGQLTQLGKKQHYKLGKYINSMYKDFVTSAPNQVYVNSSAEDRCLNSAESNLAGFYSPSRKWKLAALLFWQPMPIHYLSAESDIYLNVMSKCPRASAAVKRSLESKQIQEFYQTHQKMVQEVSKNSGIDLSNKMDALNFIDTLKAERIHRLTIPEWAKKYWEDLQVLIAEFFSALNSSPVQLRLRTGPFLGLLTENLKKKISGKTPDLKFILNSSHDVNVGAILSALNFTNIPRPPYCATLLFELHKMSDSSLTVRMLYMNSTDPAAHIDKPHVLVLDGCSEFCPVDKFMKSYQWRIPNNWEKECQEDE